MGRVSQPVAQAVRDDDLKWLVEAIESSGTLPARTVWYLFGSVLRNNTPSRDIDVLILYEDWEDVRLVRKRLDKLELDRPLHLLFMTFAEEAELNFIRSEYCVEIFPSCQIRT
jgi:predicted nucleotidyltransferase